LRGTDQFHSCEVKALGVFGSKGKLIIPFELIFNSVVLQVTEIEGLAYPLPAPTDCDKSGNAAVGQTLDFVATVCAQLWLSVITKNAKRDAMRATGRIFFIQKRYQGKLRKCFSSSKKKREVIHPRSFSHRT
jgi:hypothetical protein